MARTALLLLITACATLCATPLAADDIVTEEARSFFRTWCFDCHANGASEGNLSLDELLFDSDTRPDHERWWTILQNLRSGVMPPAEAERPPQADVEAVADWIKFRVFEIDPQNPDPGRVVLRRLNRTEYTNTIRDLMRTDYDAGLILPPDDAGFGFDNVAEALTFSPLLMEKYLHVARAVVAESVPTQTWITPRQSFSGRDFHSDDHRIQGNWLKAEAPVVVSRSVRIDEPGRYRLVVRTKRHGSFDFDPGRYSVRLELDGEERSTAEYGWDENKLVVETFEEEWEAGKHDIRFSVTPLPPENEAKGDDSDGTFVACSIESVVVEGPLDAGRFVHPVGYDHFFDRDEPPADAAARRDYAREILERFTVRAFRGPVTRATVDRLLSIAEQGWSRADATFESGVAQAFVAVLASPRFLFRMESAEDSDSNVPHAPVNEYALASRLSYFLWSTMPDEELFRLAEQHQLRAQLPQQIDRMLADERARDFIRNFTGQWLRTRDVVQTSVDPLVVLGYGEEWEELLTAFRARRGRFFGSDLTPEEEQMRDRFRELRDIAGQFNDDLKRAMARETELCVEYIANENGSLLDLLDCDYTFLNEQLAKHYGVSDVQGDEMRRVTLPADSPRGGVLTQASMLLVTSNPTRTSPVKRGLFVLDNVLGTPAPPPPDSVPDLEESAGRFGDREPSLRELLAAHRESALCASCHARMDPLGLALENFNALGMWRTEDNGQPIDASGTLITGESFQDVRELKQLLRQSHADNFYRCVTQKMLTFAIGRGLDASDEQTVDIIVDRLKQHDGRFRELLLGVIESAPFQRQRHSATTVTTR